MNLCSEYVLNHIWAKRPDPGVFDRKNTRSDLDPSRTGSQPLFFRQTQNNSGSLSPLLLRVLGTHDCTHIIPASQLEGFTGIPANAYLGIQRLKGKIILFRQAQDDSRSGTKLLLRVLGTHNCTYIIPTS